jgi:hypothetical protein
MVLSLVGTSWRWHPHAKTCQIEVTVNVTYIISAFGWYLKWKYLSLISISVTVNVFVCQLVTKCVNYIIGFCCINEWKLHIVLKCTTAELSWMSCIDGQINWADWLVTGACECWGTIGLVGDTLQCGEVLELGKRIRKVYVELCFGIINRQ